MQSPSPSAPQSSTEHRLRQSWIAQGRFLTGCPQPLARSPVVSIRRGARAHGGRGAAPVHRRCRAGAGAGRGRALAATRGRRRPGAGARRRRTRAHGCRGLWRWPWPPAIWWARHRPAEPVDEVTRRLRAAGSAGRARWWWRAACTRWWCCSTCTAAPVSGPTIRPGPPCSRRLRRTRRRERRAVRAGGGVAGAGPHPRANGPSSSREGRVGRAGGASPSVDLPP